MLALVLPAFADVGEAPVPDWVVPIDVAVDVPAPAGDSLASMQYLLCDDQTRLGPGDGATRFIQRAYRIVTHEGLEVGGRVEVDFDPDTETVTMHDVSVFRDGHWSDRYEDAHTALIQPEDELWMGLLSGRRSWVTLVPQLSVGDVLRYSYSIVTDDEVFQSRWFDSFSMGWSEPVVRRYLHIRATDERPLSVVAHGIGMGQTNGPDEWIWDITDVPIWGSAWGAPPDVLDSPFVQASEFHTWAEVAAWALPLYELEEVDGLDALVEELHAAGGDYETRALDWVQDDIRYLGLELGTGSHIPRQPAEVIDNHYGDCKDKTLLFVALLRREGMKAWPALVSSEADPIAGWSPSAGAFDHVIVYVEDEDGGHWVDPTYRLQGGTAKDRHTPAYGKALLVRPGTTGLVDVAPARMGSSEIEWHYTVSDMVSPTLETRTRTEGMRSDNLRAWFASTSLEVLSEQLRGQLERAGESLVVIEPPGIDDDRDNNVVQLDESYRIIGAWQPDPEGGESFPLYELMLFSVLPYPDQNRATDLALPLGTHEVETVILDVPDDWSFEDRTGVVENEWFRFQVRTKVQKTRVEERYELEVLSDRVAVHDMAAYQAAVDEVWDWSGYTLTRETGSSWGGDDFAMGLGTGLGVGVGLFLPAGMGLGAILVLVMRRRET